MLRVLKVAAGPTTRYLMVGVMMSRKTLNGLETPWAKVFPPKEDIVNIFSASDRCLNTIHYADFEGHGVDVCDNLQKVIEWGGPHLHAIQLDMTWPEPSQIWEAVHISRRPIGIILQIGRQALQEVDHDPEKLVERFEADGYAQIVSGLLLDQSMGEGRLMNLDFAGRMIGVLKEALPEVRLAVAGGLGPDTLHIVEPLLAEYPDLSFDAQGKLRVSGKVQDQIDWDLAARYLKKACGLLGRCHS